MSDEDFSFPVLSQTPKVPLTAASTVTDASTGITTLVQPTKSNDAQHLSRNKIPLAPGYSQIGWMTKCQRNKRLGIGNRVFSRDMAKEEVARHNTVDDGWIIIRRKVYNLTPYLNYHPGGIEILEPVLGKDATCLFDKYHRWVNVDALLEACLLGIVKQ